MGTDGGPRAWALSRRNPVYAAVWNTESRMHSRVRRRGKKARIPMGGGRRYRVAGR